MKILFLDQSGKLGGAELSLLDIATAFRDRCMVGVFADGPFPEALTARQIPVQVLNSGTLKVNKDSGISSAIGSLGALMPLVVKVIELAKQHDVIYANTQKALVVGAIAALITRKPLVYHLRDILSADHFSAMNLRVAITLANRSAVIVLANSQATADAFIAAGGQAALVRVVYNGFDPTDYVVKSSVLDQLRQEWGWQDKFIVGHFSRLSPWKGQHILLSALKDCPDSVVAVFVGDALFGEQEYVQHIQQQVQDLGLSDRVKFLGFRSDIPALMRACDLIAHTSTAPEPFGRVIVEAMMCQRPVVAAKAGGAIELLQPEKTGWLTEPGNVLALQNVIQQAQRSPNQTQAIAQAGYEYAIAHFQLRQTLQQIDHCLQQITTLPSREKLAVISRR